MPVAHNGSVELAYREVPQSGGPRGRTLLLIMGIDLTSAHWDEAFLTGLAKHRRVITFDNRGTGASTRRVDSITAARWAADACAVLDAVGAPSADVLGYSMGGRIAQEMAVRHSERVERLILLSSAVGGPRSVSPEPAGLAALAPRPGVPIEVAVRRKLVAIAGPAFETAYPHRLAALVDASVRQPTHVSILQQQLGVLATHVTGELGAVAVETLVVHGEVDPLVPIGNGELIHELIPDAKFHRLPEIGHLPPSECTERLVDLLGEFLDKP